MHVKRLSMHLSKKLGGLWTPFNLTKIVFFDQTKTSQIKKQRKCLYQGCFRVLLGCLDQASVLKSKSNGAAMSSKS